jgi:hypothetical protein
MNFRLISQSLDLHRRQMFVLRLVSHGFISFSERRFISGRDVKHSEIISNAVLRLQFTTGGHIISLISCVCGIV